MKKEGIYTTISPYWSASVKHVPASWGIEGWPENQAPTGLLFFNPRLQEGYKAWLKDAADDPATPIPASRWPRTPRVAIIQLQNEDSLLFWTMQSIKGRQLELPGQAVRRVADAEVRLARRRLRRPGTATSMAEDDPARGVVGIHIVWEFTQAAHGRPQEAARRPAPVLRRDDVSLQPGDRPLPPRGPGLQAARSTPATGRRPTSVRLNDVERWIYTANEVLAVNSYYSPVHIGPDRGWRINQGDRFQDASVLFNPRALPLNLKQVRRASDDDHRDPLGPATGLSSRRRRSWWRPTSRSRASTPSSGTATARPSGRTRIAPSGTRPRGTSGRSPHPMMLGQFPAAALMYRRGYVTQGEPVVVEHRSLEQLWERVPPMIAEDPTLRPQPRPGRHGAAVEPRRWRRPARLPRRSGQGRLRRRTRARRRSRTWPATSTTRRGSSAQQHRPARLGLRHRGSARSTPRRRRALTGFLKPSRLDQADAT